MGNQIKWAEIPPITHPLGRYWNQPKREEMLVDEIYAMMSKQTFDQLAEYSATIPTGVYAGKMWKRQATRWAKDPEGKPMHLGIDWYLCWFVDIKATDGTDRDMCMIKQARILLID